MNILLALTFTITAGWWLLPATITLIYLAWAAWMISKGANEWDTMIYFVFAIAGLFIPTLAWLIYFIIN